MIPHGVPEARDWTSHLGSRARYYVSCVQGQQNTRMAGLTHPECFASAHQALTASLTLSR